MPCHHAPEAVSMTILKMMNALSLTGGLAGFANVVNENTSTACAVLVPRVHSILDLDFVRIRAIPGRGFLYIASIGSDLAMPGSIGPLRIFATMHRFLARYS